MPDLLAIYITTPHDSDESMEGVKQNFGESLPPNVEWTFLVVSSNLCPAITQALNLGIKVAIENDFQYITWVHKDMAYTPYKAPPLALEGVLFSLSERLSWFEVLKTYLENTFIKKICASNSRDEIHQFRIGQEQTWLMKTDTFHNAAHGLKTPNNWYWFDERFIRCGGYEDWSQSLLMLGRGHLVCITDDTSIFHAGAQTRGAYDTTKHQLKNHDTYLQLSGMPQAFDPHDKRFFGLFIGLGFIEVEYEKVNNEFPELRLNLQEHLEFRKELQAKGWNIRYPGTLNGLLPKRMHPFTK